MKKRLLVLGAFFAVGLTGVCNTPNQGISLLEAMIERIESLYSFSGKMHGVERVDGELVKSQSSMIIRFNPRNLYALAYDEKGEPGNEILYREGENDNKVLVAPDGFPYVNVSLDPLSSFMRNNRHNTILEAGGTYLASVIKLMLNQKDSSLLYRSVRYAGMENFEGKRCHKVIIENPEYALVPYKVKPGETVRSIAFSLNVAEYKIVELNDEVDDFDENIEGLTLRIPNSYSKKTVLYLDATHHMPWFMENYDEKGLFSSYRYTRISLNPPIDETTFSPDNPNYGF